MEINIEKDIVILKNDLDKILFNMQNVCENTYESRMEFINKTLAKVKKKREDLLNIHPVEELRKFNPELEIYIKQIVENFDNIIAEKKEEQEKISSELKKINNKKKLSNYSRCKKRRQRLWKLFFHRNRSWISIYYKIKNIYWWRVLRIKKRKYLKYYVFTCSILNLSPIPVGSNRVFIFNIIIYFDS